MPAAGTNRVSRDGCPACRTPEPKVLFEASAGGAPSRHVLCLVCGQVFQDPCPAPALLEAYYGGEYGAVLNREGKAEEPTPVALRNAALKAQRFLQFLKPWLRERSPGAVLDVGASAGVLLDGFRARGWETFGIEPNVRFARYARQVRGHQIEAAPFDPQASWGRRFDLVTMVHVLEHLPDPLGALASLGRQLRPDGLLGIEVPNVLRPNGPLDGFFQLPHLFTFSPVTLRGIVEAAGGLEILALDARPPHLRLVARRAEVSPRLVPPNPGHAAAIRTALRRYARRDRWLGAPARWANRMLKTLVARAAPDALRGWEWRSGPDLVRDEPGERR